MFLKRFSHSLILLAFFTLLIGSSVLADDGRINRAPYHFGGDALFCSEETGCKLLDKTGHEMAHWPQSDIATAFAASDKSGQNTKVSGEGQGTYGPMQLWSVSPDATTGDNQLCMIGFDEWNKQNDMCFLVTPDYTFEQAALPVNQPAGEPIVDHSCDRWSVGNEVRVVTDHNQNGMITSINNSNGTATFGYPVPPTSYTAKCTDIEANMG